MAVTQSIANTIRDLAAAQAQIAIQRGNVNAGMIQGLAQIPANVYGMKQDMENQDLRRDSLRRAGEIQEIELKEKRRDEALLQKAQALTASMPGASTVEKTKAIYEMMAAEDPALAMEWAKGVQAELIKFAGLKEGQPGRMVPAPDDPVTGWPTSVEPRELPHEPMEVPGVYGPGITFQPRTKREIQQQELEAKRAALGYEVGKTRLIAQAQAEGRAAGTPARPQNPPNLSDVEVYADQMAQAHKGATGRDATPAQRAAWMKEYKNSGVQLRIDNPAPPRERAVGGAKAITPAQLNSILTTMKNDLGKARARYSLPNEFAGVGAAIRGQGMGMLRGEEDRIRQEAAEKLAVYGLTLEEALRRQGKATPSPVVSSQQPEQPASVVRPVISKEEALAELRRRGVIR